MGLTDFKVKRKGVDEHGRIVDVILIEVEATQDEAGHLQELLKAFEVYQARDLKRQGLWRRAGWRDSFHHMKHKFLRSNEQAERLVAQGDSPDEVDYDDQYDLINYTVFSIRNMREGNDGEDLLT